jgi:hypothetical protein
MSKTLNEEMRGLMNILNEASYTGDPNDVDAYNAWAEKELKKNPENNNDADPPVSPPKELEYSTDVLKKYEEEIKELQKMIDAMGGEAPPENGTENFNPD